MQVLPPAALNFLFGSQKVIPVRRGYGKRNQWQITMHDGVPSVAQPWFQYLSENNLMAGQETLLVMLFGVCRRMFEVIYNGHGLYILVAHITDKIKTIDGSKETLKLAVRITELWFVGTPDRSEQAEMVIVDSNHETEGPIIVLLTNARIKEGQELGVEIRSVLTCRSQWSSQPSGSAQLSSRETFISKSEAKTISEINNLCEELVYVTVGTITRIVMDNHSWCYAACIQCHKKTDVYTEPFVCPCGKHNDRAVLRYRVEVMVSYKDESTKFLLWDRECIEFIGQSADEVNTLKVEDGDLDLNVSPKALDKLLGHLLAFKQSISITSNHDPLIGLPLTPTKRQSFQECDDEARSSQISPAHLSSNKLAKHDQIE
ncbi:hypothetical protein JHK84_027718 [Glycine max]|nr:hypothetical protein JHK86_027590 [Glycine max]KAG5151246.1 hypothetical protein JHK84_027718 [Glycine max]